MAVSCSDCIENNSALANAGPYILSIWFHITAVCVGSSSISVVCVTDTIWILVLLGNEMTILGPAGQFKLLIASPNSSLASSSSSGTVKACFIL